MIINSLYIMFMCLIITITIEILLAYALKVRDKLDFLNVLLVNILTNPILVITTYMIGIASTKMNQDIFTYVFEVLVVLAEGYIYKKVLKYKKINCFILSLILNIGSYLIGLLINF